MRNEEAVEIVKLHLNTSRFEHTLRVAKVAVELAKQNDVSARSAELAAIFHDCAKNLPKEKLKRWIKNSALPKDLLNYNHELWHGPVGSILVEKNYGIKDLDILNAIRYHTTGRINMSKLEKIVIVADYIEPKRDFPGVGEVREVAEKDLLIAAWMVSRNTIQHLLRRNSLVYPDTLHAYNDLTRQIVE